MNLLANRRQEEKERRRAEILDAAEAVAAEIGWDAMTMDLLARKARLSRALVYVYFQDKTDLMFGVGQRALRLLRESFETATKRQKLGLEQLRAMGRAYVSFAREQPLYFSILTRCELRSPTGGPPGSNETECMVCGDELHRLMVKAIENGMRDGSIRADAGDADLIAISLWGFMHGVIQLAASKANLMAHRGINVDKLLKQALTMATMSVASDTKKDQG